MDALRSRTLAVSLLAAGMVGCVLAAPARAMAGLVSPTNVAASSLAAGFPASDVIDTGATRLLTDRASRQGEGGGDLNITPPGVRPFPAAVAFTKPVPAKPGSGADFVISEALPGFAAQYMRHAVLALSGPTNTPGLANVHFAMTEPSSLALLGVGSLVVLGAGRKWRSRAGAPRGTGSRDAAWPARIPD